MFKVSILQFKPNFGDIDGNFQFVSGLIERAIKDSPDVIVLPELWSTGFYPKPVKDFADKNGHKAQHFLGKFASKYNINIIGGTIIVEDDNKFYNRCFIFSRQGKMIAAYDKIHLFSMSKENEVFSAGNEIPIFELDGVKCSVAICYDVRFPELIREAALNDIEVLFLPAAWPLKRLDHWQILIKARAIENQIFVVAANSAGYSAIINPWGEVLAEGNSEENIITSNIDLSIRSEIKNNMAVFADRRDFTVKKIIDIIQIQ